MSEKFHLKKKKILDALSKPDEDYADASPKGSVDVGVRDLIAQINDAPGFVTTSSCAGRIAVYLDGPPKPRQSRPVDEDGTAATMLPKNSDGTVSSASGKGGGKWLFSSHSPIDLSSVATAGMLYHLLGFSAQADVSFPPADATPQFVHFKFEPMILHILASSAEDAQTALQAATQSGFRESGISGLLDSQGDATIPMVAVRSSGLALDSIIGFKESNTGSMVPMVSEAYLRTIVQLANERFSTNEERKARFSNAFNNQRSTKISPSKAGRPGLDSRVERRERQQAEGLARKHQMLEVSSVLDGMPHGSDEHGPEGEIDYSLELLENGEDTRRQEHVATREPRHDM